MAFWHQAKNKPPNIPASCPIHISKTPLRKMVSPSHQHKHHHQAQPSKPHIEATSRIELAQNPQNEFMIHLPDRSVSMKRNHQDAKQDHIRKETPDLQHSRLGGIVALAEKGLRQSIWAEGRLCWSLKGLKSSRVDVGPVGRCESSRW